MSESNNNIPMRITQLPEAETFDYESYVPAAKGGTGTKKVKGSTLLAELIDARQGADGVTYPSAGDAVRGQVESLTDSNIETYQRIYKDGGLVDYVLKYGFNHNKILDSDGKEVANTAYSTISEYVPINEGDYIYFLTDSTATIYTLYVCLYDSNKVIIDSRAVITAKVPLNQYYIAASGAKYMRFSVSKSTATNIRVVNQNVYKNTNDLIEENSNIFLKNTFALYSVFKNGDANFSTVDLSIKNSVYSEELIFISEDTTIYAKDGFQFNAFPYNAGEAITNSGWTTKFKLSKDYGWRLCIKRITPISGEVADIKQFVSAVYFYNKRKGSKTVEKEISDNNIPLSMLFEETDFSNGSYSGSTFVDNIKRLATTEIKYFDKSVKISSTNDYEIMGLYYNSSGTYIANTGWVDNFYINENLGIKISIRRKTETDECSVYDTFLNSVFVERVNEKNINDLFDLLMIEEYNESIGLVSGFLNSNGGVNYSDNSYKITAGFIPIKCGQVLHFQKREAATGTGAYIIAFYDEDYNLIERFENYNGFANNQNYIIVSCHYENCAYMKACFSNANASLYDIYKQDVITDITQKGYNYKYKGEAIDLKSNYLDIRKVFNVDKKFDGTSQAQQGCAIYGNYLFVAFSQYGDAGDLNKIRIYNLTTGATVSTIDADTGHGNALCFSNEYYDTEDIFPLLYASETSVSNGYTLINVIRINTTSATTVKTLKVPADHAVEHRGGKQGVIDSFNNILYTVECENYSTPLKFSAYDLSNLTENQDSTYTPAFIESFTLPSLGVAFQGMKYRAGKIYLIVSSSSSSDTTIYVIDMFKKKIVTILDEFPTNILEEEIEDLDFVRLYGKDCIYIQGNSGSVYLINI